MGAKTQPCFTPLETGKGSEAAPCSITCAIIPSWKDLMMLTNLSGQPSLDKMAHRPPTADGIKSLCEIHKQYVEVLVLLAALLLYLAYREDHVYCSPVTPEAALALGDYIVQQVLSDAVQDDTGHDLP